MNLSKIVGAVSLHTRVSTLAVAALLGLSFGLSGCQGPKGDTGPAASAQQPTGTIQGSLRDSVTQQPIVGALLDIGVATATTNAQGEFVMRNVVVPVDANNNVNAASYPVNINLRSVSSPVTMASATATPRYADFFYQTIPVTFTPLYSSTTATPVTGLIATVDIMVGKLAANITGVVADSVTKQPVAAGFTVKLVSLGSTNSATGNGGTGALENIVGSTTTDASGGFTFANIESLQNFRIDAWNAAQTYRGTANVAAPADGQTRTLSIQGNTAVLVASTDILAPTIISVTPEQNADIAPAATDVVFTFSEPILQTADTSTSPSVATGLYNTIAVNFNGAKASNIARSVSWNATSTQLTVTIPALAASSKYSVSLAGTGTVLKDLNSNVVTNIATAGKGVLAFTTNGSTTPAAPAAVTVTNGASLNYNSPTVLLDWLPVSGAKAYNVYRAQNFAGAAGQLQLILPVVPVATPPVSTLTSNFSDAVPNTPTFPFVSSQNKLTYTYVVRSVSADNVESADSTAVPAQDAVVPTATIPAGLAATYTITFIEPVDEATATTLANYALTQGVAASAPIINNAVLNANLTTVTLTLSAATVTGNTLTITGVKDIAGNAMTGAARTF
ncbi:MAG: Ig-like domain-containing protein [Gallionella sp.]|nr:Ig-like domain-containing protein [Gallionella sp.]